MRQYNSSGFYMPGLDPQVDAHLAGVINADPSFLWKNALIDDPNGRIINNAGTTRHEEYLEIEKELQQVRRSEQPLYNDLLSAGLTRRASIKKQLVGYEKVNEFQAAQRSQNPTSFQNNSVTFTPDFVPLPLTYQSFNVPWRQGEMEDIMPQGTAETAYQVAKSLEDLITNGDTTIAKTYDSVQYTIYGYTNSPNRTTGDITDWTDVATNGDTIQPEVLAILSDMFTGGRVSGKDTVRMYVADNFYMPLQNIINSANGSNITYLDLLLQIKEIASVEPAPELADSEILLVEMKRRTVQIGVANGIITVPHLRTNPMAPQVMTTYAAATPIVKNDINNATGIGHGSIP